MPTASSWERIAVYVYLDTNSIGSGPYVLKSYEPESQVVLEANPLERLRNTNTVRWVMKNGRLYEGATLDAIWPRERPPRRTGAARPWRSRPTSGRSRAPGGRRRGPARQYRRPPSGA